MTTELLTYRQVEEQYGIKRSVLVMWVHRKQIPHIRIGPRTVRFDREAIAKWLTERTVTPREAR